MKEAEIRLSKLIDVLKERFGTDFKPGDQLFFESIREDALLDSSLNRRPWPNNTIKNLAMPLTGSEDLVVSRMEQNGEISAQFFNDREFRDIVSQKLMREVFDQIRETQEVGARKPWDHRYGKDPICMRGYHKESFSILTIQPGFPRINTSDTKASLLTTGGLSVTLRKCMPALSSDTTTPFRPGALP
jgi:hypothetical protein